MKIKEYTNIHDYIKIKKEEKKQILKGTVIWRRKNAITFYIKIKAHVIRDIVLIVSKIALQSSSVSASGFVFKPFLTKLSISDPK